MRNRNGGILALFFCLMLPAWSATIRGKVSDPSGAVIPKARGTVRNDASGETKSASADPSGAFEVGGLAVGDYTVSVDFDGFKTASQTVHIDKDTGFDVVFKLEILPQETEVE